MRSFFFKLLLLIIVLALGGADSLAQYTWTRHPKNPILSGGGTGTWDNHTLFPMVLFNADSNRYEMWYCGETVIGGSRSIGFAWSLDGINWTKYSGNPALTPSSGTWDASSVELGWVLRENGQYKLWYYGKSGNTHQIGYATSPNGINWTKRINPVFSAGSSAWEAGGILWCCVLSNAGNYTMYYTGTDISNANHRIGRASSLDGITWQRDAINNPILQIGSAGQWDDNSVAGPQCLSAGNVLYLYYTGWANSYVGTKIGLATSTDNGNTWAKYSNNPVLDKGTAGSWDANYVEAGAVILHQDTLRLWYDGSRDNTATYLWRIGLATSPFVVIPVELTSFTASSNGAEVTLNWSTATELNNYGFEIQRKVLGGDFATVAFVKGQGTTTQQNQYSFADKNLDEGKYFYRLKQMDYGGQHSYSQSVEVDVRMLNKYSLEQNYPNPFNPVTTIGYVLQEKGNAKLTLLNSLGEEIAVLINEERDKGYHKVEFDGSKLSSGVYFYQLRAGDFVEAKKMILLR